MKQDLSYHDIDLVAGHAGKLYAPDPGAVDPVDGMEWDSLATYEVEHTIPLAELAADRLRYLGARVSVLTTSVAESVRLIATHGPTAAVSLHFNSAEDTSAHGFEVWHYPDSTLGGRELALHIAAELEAAPAAWGIKGFLYADRGAKPAGPEDRARSFVSVSGVPAVLVEFGFISNPAEERIVNSALFRLHASAAVARGIVSWVKDRETGRPPE